MRYFTLFFIALLAACSSPAPDKVSPATDPALAVLQAGEQRDIQQIITFLQSEQDAERLPATHIAASMQDKAMLPALHQLLERDSLLLDIHLAAAFAIGQIGDRSSVTELAAALAKDRDARLTDYLAEALGKIGGEEAAEQIGSLTASSAKALGLLRLAIGGEADVRQVEQAIELLDDTDAQVRLHAAHALLRQREVDLTPFLETLSTRIVLEADREVKGVLLAALRHTVGSAKQALLVQEFEGRAERHSFTRAVSALGAEDLLATYAYLLPHLTDRDSHSALATARYLDANFQDAFVDHYITMVDSVYHTEVKAKMLGTLAALGNVEAMDRLRLMANDSTDIYTAVFAIQNMGHRQSEKDFLLSVVKDEGRGILRGHAYDALLGLDTDGARTDPGIIEYGLSSGDIALICTAAAHLRDARFRMSRIPFVDMLHKADAGLDLPRENEARVELQRTLAFLAEEDFVMPPLSDRGSEPTPFRFGEGERPVLRFVTSKGSFEITLRPDKAPSSVAAIHSLASSGYYDGKTFHRVISDFVAQGGCPRGDGWGSLDFSLRSEFSDLRYEEGTVGLASAGKDTEGCQFFITHGRTPHLDGRYTIIGSVTQGMEIVQRLQLGDRIAKVVLP